MKNSALQQILNFQEGATLETYRERYHFVTWKRVEGSETRFCVAFGTDGAGSGAKKAKNRFYFTDNSRGTGHTHRCDWIAAKMREIDRHEQRIAERKAERQQRVSDSINIEPGTIFYSSWGYEQTNVNFFQVTEVKAKKVFVREICRDLESDGQLSMSGKVTARKDDFLDEKTYQLGITNYGYRVDRMDVYLDKPGQSHYCSWYG